MIDRFQGDPKLYLTPDGVNLNIIGGQPVMDQGLENQATLSLFVGEGWWGNDVLPDANKLGSDFEETAKGSITLTKLNDIRQSGINALQYEAFGKIEGEVLNPESSQLKTIFTISPPGGDVQSLILTRNGQNWINQAAQGET